MLKHFSDLKRRHADSAESGFTLIELLLVVVILGVLAAIVVFGVSGINDNSKVSACKADHKAVQIASEAYWTNATPHAYAADMAALKTAGFLRDVPSTTNGYTITYAAAGGTVAASGACTIAAS